MKFKKTEDEIYYFTHSSESNLIFIGLYRTMYGVRIRAGFKDLPSCHVDWCCGDSVEIVNSFFNRLISILEKRKEDLDAFKNIPLLSDIKPLHKDTIFTEKIISISSNKKFVDINEKTLINLSDFQSVPPINCWVNNPYKIMYRGERYTSVDSCIQNVLEKGMDPNYPIFNWNTRTKEYEETDEILFELINP
jgi:hypothetical protein